MYLKKISITDRLPEYGKFVTTIDTAGEHRVYRFAETGWNMRDADGTNSPNNNLAITHWLEDVDLANAEILTEITNERKRQDAKWGEQNHPILDAGFIARHPDRIAAFYEIPTERRAKHMCEASADVDQCTWLHILIEEVSEVASCGYRITDMRKELVQVAAVTVAMIASLDRNGR